MVSKLKQPAKDGKYVVTFLPLCIHLSSVDKEKQLALQRQFGLNLKKSRLKKGACRRPFSTLTLLEEQRALLNQSTSEKRGGLAEFRECEDTRGEAIILSASAAR